MINKFRHSEQSEESRIEILRRFAPQNDIKPKSLTIGIITTSRADYGIYVPVIKELQTRKGVKVKLFVTGSHFDKALGYSFNEIKKDGFAIAGSVKLSSGDSSLDVANKTAQIIKGMASLYQKNKPDVLFVLGDRYDMHAAAIAAVSMSIPLVHIHGGEATFGSMDEYYRHSLTKLSNIHFAATKEYANRIMHMGENPKHVFVSGAPALDTVRISPLLNRTQLTKKFGIDFSQPIMLVTLHPETLALNQTSNYTKAVMNALVIAKKFNIVFTAPNADAQGRMILKAINDFCRRNTNAKLVEHFGHQGYLSMMKESALMVGNSSSGIIEAASFQLPVINIGKRQDGRIKPRNIIDVPYHTNDIVKAVSKASTAKFNATLKTLKNPYGDGHAATRIVKHLLAINLKQLSRKEFYQS